MRRRRPCIASAPIPATAPCVRFNRLAGRQTHALEVALRGRVRKRLQTTAQYTFGDRPQRHERNQLPAGEQLRPPGEYGRANFYQRHRLEALVQFDAGAWARFGAAASSVRVRRTRW